jgi:cell division protein FtsL
MAVSSFHLNRFERALFRIAVVMAFLLIAIRVGAIAIAWYLHLSR